MQVRAPRTMASALGAAVLAVGALTGCGGGGAAGGAPQLTWYVNPDAGGQEDIAARCTGAAAGRYSVSTSLLPRESSDQRLELVRRLAADDPSVDIMSLDPPSVPEMAQAGFLAPVPPDVAERVSEGVVASAIEGSTWDGELVAVPFWANTQLLWYRTSHAAAAGLDLSQPVTWRQLVDAATASGTELAVQGARAESLTVWLNALVESAGGQIVTQPSSGGAPPVLGLDSEAGRQAASIMRDVGRSGVGGPSLTTSGEAENAAAFQDGRATFMVNWPFVWPQVLVGVRDGAVAASVAQDYGWALYPRVDADRPSAPPYGGINLGVGAFSEHVDLAYEASECITSTEHQTSYFLSDGNPPSKVSVYDDPAVTAAFPMAATILESLEVAAPRPRTAYYSEVSGSIQREYHPPGSVDPARTGEEAAGLVTAVLANEALL